MVGAIDHDEWRRVTSAVVGDAAVTAWLAYHGEANQAVVALLKALKNQNVRVVLLSNATARLWDDLPAQRAVLQRADNLDRCGQVLE
jgi:FMN phosphatase YigB (HAD superfamily)